MLNDLSNIRSFEDIRLFYFKYRDTPQFSVIVTVSLAVVSLMIIGRVVMPQFENWFSITNEVKATQERVASLQKNIAILQSINDTQLENNFHLAKAALPYEKDYTGVITTINSVAITAGVALDDYTFQVGNLSTISAQLAPETAISVKLSIKGDLNQLQAFMQKLNAVLPLAEVVNVSYTNNGAGVGLIFFYKYLPQKLQIPYTDPLREITPDKQRLLDTLSTWNKASTGLQPSPPPGVEKVASSSGI